MATIYYIMGVSGSGKSTIGSLLADELQIPFFDADDFHPPANVQKMASGKALTDADRKPWLLRLRSLAHLEGQKEGAVIACSALKAAYRHLLSEDLQTSVQWVFLHGPASLILKRMTNRPGHFMPPELLRSQFDALEIPENALTISILAAPEEIVKTIVKTFHNDKTI